MNVDINIPNKSHFKISEVSGLTGIKPYVLRFWEEEFDEIRPLISSSGQKLYQHKDIEFILKVKYLLFEEKLSIEKAKQRLKSLLEPSEIENEDTSIQKLVLAKEKLKELIALTR